MTERTVIAWDGSEAGNVALAWAVERERSSRGNLLIVRVIDDTESGDAVDRAVQELEDEVLRLRRTVPGIHVNAEVIRGDLVEELRTFAGPSSLLVVGTGRRSGAHYRYGWSPGARLASSPRGPVAIIPSGLLNDRVGVVVGVNGSDESISAALFAAAEATRRGEDLHAVHAWVEPPTTGVGGLNPEFIQWLKEGGRMLLDDSLAPVVAAYPALHVHRHLVHGLASSALLDRSPTAALLVVGTRGHGAVRRFLLGSVSHSLVLDIQIPTIVVGNSTHDQKEGHGSLVEVAASKKTKRTDLS